MTELKPCPFCGSSDVGLEPEWACRYQCNDCGAKAPQCATRDSDDTKAFKWNTRVSPWRSLKDDPPPNGTIPVLVRRFRGNPPRQNVDVMSWVNEPALGTVRSRGYTEWMEVPE